MPLDHFVSQVHLKNFYTDSGRLVGVKKDDLKKFYAKSDDVCRRPDGSTNGYLTEPRAVEEFLKEVEPKYNAAVTALRERNIDADGVYVLAGFIAYLMTCSPTAMRISTPHLAASVQTAAEIIDAQGLLPPAPDILGNKSMTELLEDGSVKISVDEKYPQAMGISVIEAVVGNFGNALWDVMFADRSYGSFLTSDFPVGLGASHDKRVVSRTVPLAPDIAVRIHPMIGERDEASDFSFPQFRARFVQLGLNEMREVNRQIVQAAETMVFYNDDVDWLVPFVRKNRDYRMDSIVDRIPAPGGGKFIVASQRIMPYKRASGGTA
jgi:hypothetical protein